VKGWLDSPRGLQLDGLLTAYAELKRRSSAIRRRTVEDELIVFEQWQPLTRAYSFDELSLNLRNACVLI
jgi:hypothetical protein